MFLTFATLGKSLQATGPTFEAASPVRVEAFSGASHDTPPGRHAKFPSPLPPANYQSTKFSWKPQHERSLHTYLSHETWDLWFPKPFVFLIGDQSLDQVFMKLRFHLLQARELGG